MITRHSSVSKQGHALKFWDEDPGIWPAGPAEPRRACRAARDCRPRALCGALPLAHTPALEAPRPRAHPRCCCCRCFPRLEVPPPGWTQSPLSLRPDAAFSGRPRPAGRPYHLPPPPCHWVPWVRAWEPPSPKGGQHSAGGPGAWWPPLPRVGDMSTHTESATHSPHTAVPDEGPVPV